MLHKGLKLQYIILGHGMDVEMKYNIATNYTVQIKAIFRNMFVTHYIF
jgi:hypothetical protein